jgi:hypothetical protein
MVKMLKSGAAFELDGMDPKILFYGKPCGLYLIEADSFIYKTQLYKALNKYKALGKKVDTYSYEDFLAHRDIRDLLGRNLKLVYVDKYESYQDHSSLVAQCMARLARNCIVLVSCTKPPRLIGTYSRKVLKVDDAALIIK